MSEREEAEANVRKAVPAMVAIGAAFLGVILIVAGLTADLSAGSIVTMLVGFVLVTAGLVGIGRVGLPNLRRALPDDEGVASVRVSGVERVKCACGNIVPAGHAKCPNCGRPVNR